MQQYYTEERTFRITGDNGKRDFMTANKQVPDQDEQGNAIWRTLNDMSTTEFDIVVSDTPATTTQRIAQFFALTDAVSKLGVFRVSWFSISLLISATYRRKKK